MMQELFQHIQVFGRPGAVRVRIDNDADREAAFEDLDTALIFTIRHLMNHITPAKRKGIMRVFSEIV